MEAFAKLGIDWKSMLLYLVNMGLLLALLTRWLYRPLLKVMDERRETVRKSLADAELLKHAFETESKRQKRETQDLLTKMQAEVTSAKTQAEARAKELIADAEARRTQMLADVRQEVEQTKQGMLKEVETEILSRIEKTVLHVLKHKVPEGVVRASAQESWQDLSFS